MKKVFSVITVAALAATFVACGPSAEEKAKMEEEAKRVKDSTEAAINASMEANTEVVSDSAATTTETAAPAAEEKH